MEQRHMERDFKEIWIPREIWLSPQLTLMEKVLFVEIHSLDNERGCYASNGYFADFFDISDRQIRKVIGSLKTKGFVTVTVKNTNERVIRTAGKWRRISEAEKGAFRAAPSDRAGRFCRQSSMPWISCWSKKGMSSRFSNVVKSVLMRSTSWMMQPRSLSRRD
jgi:Helix-turn-helix domain